MSFLKKDELGVKQEFQRMDEEFMNSDKFLGKDVLTMPNKISSSRLIMFNSHLEQNVVLKKPDFPRIFTGYENQVGKYSSGYFKTKEDCKIVKKIEKFPWIENGPYILIIKNKKKQYDIILREETERLTEAYGYSYQNEIIDSYNEKDTIPKDTILFKSQSFDKDNNYCYGINAKTVYMIHDKTIEDALVISESFAKKLTSQHVEEVEININNNDILCNIYPDKSNQYNGFKMFPDIGENTRDSVLVVRRRVNNDYSLFDLKNDTLKSINFQNDSIYYADGRIIDISIYCNSSLEEVKKYHYNNQIVKYLERQLELDKIIIKFCEKILKKGFTLGDTLSFMYKRALVPQQDKFRWTSQKEFDNLIVVFKIVKDNPISIGSKLSGRYGNKGVISNIIPDENMPVLDNGVRAEIIFNALSIVNRLGSAPLYEIELNFISDEIVSRIKEMKSIKEREKILFKYLSMVHEGYSQFIREEYDRSDKKKFFDDIIGNGIYLLQPPFFGNIKFEQLGEIYKEFKISPRPATIEGKATMQNLIIADQYLLRLKHDPASKFSARSSAHIDIRNRPSKSLSYKKHSSLISNTPIRIGEMEVSNLLLAKRSDKIAKLMSMMSTSEENRHFLVNHLLLEPMTSEIPVIKLPKIDNYNRNILDTIFKSLGIKLTDSKPNKKPSKREKDEECMEEKKITQAK